MLPVREPGLPAVPVPHQGVVAVEDTEMLDVQVADQGQNSPLNSDAARPFELLCAPDEGWDYDVAGATFV